MVKYKIEMKEKVPSLVDLASLAILRHDLKWETTGILPPDLAQYVRDLALPDMEVINNRKWQKRKLRSEAMRRAHERGEEPSFSFGDMEEEGEEEGNGNVVVVAIDAGAG